MQKFVLPCVLVAGLVGCASSSEKPAEAPPEAVAAKAPEAPPEPPPPPPPPPPAPAPTLVVKGFATPESVLWDEAADRYLVSNINGAPADKDNNGYISVMSADGVVTTEKWIAAGKDGVTLNAPKGTAIVKGVLYVADIDTVRMFDAKSGAPKGDITLAGATFANDVVAGADGKIYVSDTGIGADFKSNGSDGVWVISGGKASVFFAAKDMGGPNGLAFSGKTLVANGFGTDELFKLDGKKGKLEVTKAPGGGGDGLYVDADGTIWTSSWGANAIYKGKLGGTFEAVIQNVPGAADFAVNTKKKQIVVPRFMDNTVEFYAIP